MKKCVSLIVTAAVIAIAGAAVAAPPGQDMQWTTDMGVVTFSGQKHADAGKECTDCHDLTGGDGGLFAMQSGTAEQTMAEMNEGKGCGSCHNGELAFASSDPATCMNCHKM